MINPQNTAQLCLKTVLKVEFVNFLYCQIWIGALYAIFVRTKSMYLWACGSFRSANHKKKFGPANRKSSKSHICGRSEVRIFEDFSFAEPKFPDRPPLQKEQIRQPGLLVFMKAVSRVCESGRTWDYTGANLPPPPATQREYCTAVEAFYLLYLVF